MFFLFNCCLSRGLREPKIKRLKTYISFTIPQRNIGGNNEKLNKIENTFNIIAAIFAIVCLVYKA